MCVSAFFFGGGEALPPLASKAYFLLWQLGFPSLVTLGRTQEPKKKRSYGALKISIYFNSFSIQSR